jgi:hypothetical protein
VTANGGWLWAKGALDFAGGTVVHINAGVAGLVGAYMVGKRIGYGKESLTPHSLTLTMVGAALLWVGWFGFNAGSNLEANGVTAMAFANTLFATAAATLAWIGGEALSKGKASMLGAASGAVAGLVAITPACGFVGVMGSIVIGLLAGLICLWGVNGLKRMLGADDALDVFGVHGVGGILGALLTGVFASPSLGGTGIYDYVANKVSPDYSIGGQVWIQFQGVLTTLVWSGVVAFICYKVVDLLIGLRVTEEEEREGLDISSHGETAYNTCAPCVSTTASATRSVASGAARSTRRKTSPMPRSTASTRAPARASRPPSRRWPTSRPRPTASRSPRRPHPVLGRHGRARGVRVGLGRRGQRALARPRVPPVRRQARGLDGRCSVGLPGPPGRRHGRRARALLGGDVRGGAAAAFRAFGGHRGFRAFARSVSDDAVLRWRRSEDLVRHERSQGASGGRGRTAAGFGLRDFHARRYAWLARELLRGLMDVERVVQGAITPTGCLAPRMSPRLRLLLYFAAQGTPST